MATHMAADRILLVSVDERRLAAVRTALEPVGHEVLSAGNATEAMAKFGAVLGMDHENEEARQGMKDATILLGENIRKMVPHGEPSPR